MTENTPLSSALPSSEQALVGRDALLDELTSRVTTHRLLTLTGPGGVGKTSIAQHLAAYAAPAFPDGVRWVDLAALADEAAVPQAVAAACDLAEQRDMAWIDTLVGALHTTRALLVLDNCEHLRAACAELSARLLAACPQIHILATSREPLGLAEELRCPVPSLDDHAAVALFGLRATEQRASFAINDQTQPAIASICAQLDGMPLAIELAAARITLLNVSQIAERMEQSLRLLASRDPERPLRQRSLRAALDWSYVLLSADEQALFRQLAVFAGSFDYDAVEAVCRVPAPLDALHELIDSSLVEVAQHTPTARYRMHAVVRQYAAERLGEQGEQAARERHLAWAIALAEHADQTFSSTPHDAWLARLVLEHDNLRSALQATAQHNDAASMLRLAGALRHFWNSVSISEGREWLARARGWGPLPPSVISAKAWNCESFLAYRQGDYDSMHAAATTALHEAMEIEYAEGIANAAYLLGIHAEMKGNAAQARHYYQQSLSLYREFGDRRGMSQTLNGLAHVAKLEGHFDEARHYYSQGLALARADGDRLTTALLLISLANLTLDSGDLDAAEAAYAESLAHLRAVGNASYVLYAINGLGEVAHFRKDFAAASEQYHEGLQMARALGLKDMEAQFLAHLGRTATDCGDYATAAGWLGDALGLCLALDRRMRIAAMVHFCANLVVCLGYPAQATKLFAAGFQVVGADDFSYLGSEGPALLARFQAARDALPPAEYALAVADGQLLNLDQAANLALSAMHLPQRQIQAEPPPELRIFAFGQLRVVRDGRELTGDDWVYNKPKELLLFLLLVASADKAEIGAALWPDASAEQLKQNFRVAIYHLRRALGRAEWITFNGGRYAFNRALRAWIDVAAFEHAVEQASSDPAQRMKHLRIAAALYTGDLALGELESDAALIRRERLREQALAVLLALGGLHEHNGQHSAAADIYRRALAIDSYGEAAQRGLMRSLAQQGEGGAALAQYQRFVALLARELGVSPTPETVALAAQIQAGAVV